MFDCNIILYLDVCSLVDGAAQPQVVDEADDLGHPHVRLVHKVFLMSEIY